MRIAKERAVRDLAYELEMSFGFIGNIEHPKQWQNTNSGISISWQ